MKRRMLTSIITLSVISSMMIGCGGKKADNKEASTQPLPEVTSQVDDASESEQTENIEEETVLKNIEISDWEYDDLSYFSRDYLVAKDNDKFSLIDYNGNKIDSGAFSQDIETEWDTVRLYMQDGCMIGVAGSEDTGYKSYLIDRNLNVLSTDEDEDGYYADYRDNLIRKEYSDKKKLTFITKDGDPINITIPSENISVSYSSYGKMIIGGGVYMQNIDAFSYVINTEDLIANRKITTDIIKPCRYEGYYVIPFINSINKEGWISGAICERDAESEATNLIKKGYFNVNTGEFRESDQESNSCSYRAEKNGCGMTTIIDGRVLQSVDNDGTDEIYKIYDISKESYASEERYYRAAISYSDYLLVKNMDKKWGFIKNDDLTHAGEWYEDASAFINGYALVKNDGVAYLVDENFETVSESIELESAKAPTSYFDFSDLDDSVIFFVEGVDGKYRLATVSD